MLMRNNFSLCTDELSENEEKTLDVQTQNKTKKMLKHKPPLTLRRRPFWIRLLIWLATRKRRRLKASSSNEQKAACSWPEYKMDHLSIKSQCRRMGAVCCQSRFVFQPKEIRACLCKERGGRVVFALSRISTWLLGKRDTVAQCWVWGAEERSLLNRRLCLMLHPR